MIPGECFSAVKLFPKSKLPKQGGYFISDLNRLVGRTFDHSMSLNSINYCQRPVDATQALISFFQLNLQGDYSDLALNGFGDKSNIDGLDC